MHSILHDSVKQEVVESWLFLSDQHPEYLKEIHQSLELFKELYEMDIEQASQELSPEQRDMIRFKQEVQLNEKNPEHIVRDMSLGLHQELKRVLTQQSEQLLSEIRTAEHARNNEKVLSLQQKNHDIRKRIDTITNLN
jgi:hypothetical protein